MNTYKVYFKNNVESRVAEVTAASVREALKKVEDYLGFDRWHIEAYEAEKFVGAIYCSTVKRF